jgi:glycine betaine/proline transport system ATP-binding protein
VRGDIQIRNLYKIFGRRVRDHIAAVQAGMGKAELREKTGHILGLRNINLTIRGGRIQVIMGLSGSGKSTLIRHINRLIDPTVGEILIDGVDVIKMSQSELRDFRRREIAMVFQKFGLLPHRTVLDNVLFGLEISGMKRAVAEDRSHEWIERVGLKGFEACYPSQLSGGMQQRVGLARALAMDAPVLLMDEAYSALDPLIRTEMQGVLLDLQKTIRKTIIFITHDLDEALTLGDQIAILREGEIVQQGTREEIVMKPADEYVERFVRDVNRGRVITVDMIMTGAQEGVADDTIRVESGMVVNEAISKLSRQTNKNTCTVVGADGRPLGCVGMRQLLAAVAIPEARA